LNVYRHQEFAGRFSVVATVPFDNATISPDGATQIRFDAPLAQLSIDIPQSRDRHVIQVSW
jgi:hypothetical protein